MCHRHALARALFATLFAVVMAGCGGGDPEDGGVNRPTVDPQELRNSAR